MAKGKDLRNSIKDGISITLEGKERCLKYDLNALIELEDKFGSMDNIFEAMQSGKMKNVRTMLWAGLLHEDEDLTEKEVGSMVTVGNINELNISIPEAFMKSLPELEGIEVDEEKK